MKDGICSYVNLGDGYSTGDCYWEVIKNYDQTHDGIREIQFDAMCYVPRSDQKYMIATESNLYDFYTGKWFTAASTHGESNRGENYYLHTIDWNGQSETIEFAFSTDWQENVGDWEYILTKSYVVYLPEGYDGLVFAAQPAVPTYGNLITLYNYTEDNIMNNDLMNPYDYLMFNICD